MRFHDQVVLVTGGGAGIGQAIARRFAAEGAAVVIADRLLQSAKRVAAEIGRAGGKVLAVRSDVTQSSDVDAMVSAAEKTFGSIDIVVNNAGGCEGDGLVSLDQAAWDRDVALNLTSTFLCAKRVLPGMIEKRRGVILNISSVNGLTFLGSEAYSAAKAGVISLTRSLAVRYGRYGIRSNVIAPGSVRTPVWQDRLERDPKLFETVTKWYPLGRVGEPEDVAHAALFLASQEASWISGIVLPVDGGLLAGNEVMRRELMAEDVL